MFLTYDFNACAYQSSSRDGYNTLGEFHFSITLIACTALSLIIIIISNNHYNDEASRQSRKFFYIGQFATTTDLTVKKNSYNH